MQDKGSTHAAVPLPSRAPRLAQATSPVHFVAAFLVALAAQQWLALPMPPLGLQRALQIAGTVLANAGLALALCCQFLFLLRRTTLLPARAPSALVEVGPYRYSRNPMYLSLLLSYVGLALLLGVPWALLVMPVPLLALLRVVIPYEEAQLRRQFDARYLDYCGRVPRWL